MSAKAESLIDDHDFQILYDSSFKQGIVGLSAGRIAASIHKPTLVLADHGDLLTGSARSVEGFNIYDFFQDFDELEAFGGHPQACGMSLKKEKYESFCRHVHAKMEETGFVYHEPEGNAIAVDADELSIDNVMGLAAIRPIPKDIQPAEFAVLHPVVLDKLDRPKVLKYHYANACGGFDGVIFNQAIPACDEPEAVIGSLSINRWRSRISVQMNIDAFDQ
jgi:single-stranded-DNA-specific exonuclease